MKDLPTGASGVIGLHVPNHVEVDSNNERDTAIKQLKKSVLETKQKQDCAIFILAKVIIKWRRASMTRVGQR